MNNMTLCACGCGNSLTPPKYPSWTRRFIHGHNAYGRKQSDITKQKFRVKVSGRLHWKWHGGRMITYKGYIKILVPDHREADKDGYVLEHRIVYEKYYNCCLLSYTLIHHINENRQDNRIENLQPMMRGVHSSYHNYKRKDHHIPIKEIWLWRRLWRWLFGVGRLDHWV